MAAEMEQCREVRRRSLEHQQVDAKVEEEQADVNCLVEAEGVKNARLAEDVGEGEEEDSPGLVVVQKYRVEKSHAHEKESWATFAFGGI